MLKNLLPSHSRVWIYQSVRKFSSDESSYLNDKINRFVSQWTSHRQGVVGDGALLYDRFIVLMADEDQVKLGGCSVDSSVRFVKEAQHELNTNFFDRWNIAYKRNNEVLSCNRNEFEQLIASGGIQDDTIIFNNLVQTRKDFETRWQIPYGESWLKNLQASNTPFSSIL